MSAPLIAASGDLMKPAIPDSETRGADHEGCQAIVAHRVDPLGRLYLWAIFASRSYLFVDPDRRYDAIPSNRKSLGRHEGIHKTSPRSICQPSL
jgi:hypothetical protein